MGTSRAKAGCRSAIRSFLGTPLPPWHEAPPLAAGEAAERLQTQPGSQRERVTFDAVDLSSFIGFKYRLMRLYRTSRGYLIEERGQFHFSDSLSWDTLVTRDDLYGHLEETLRDSEP